MNYNKPFGLMFHYFHDNNSKIHQYQQGSITVNELEFIIKKYKENNKFNILTPQEWIDKVGDNTLRINDICFTFDDGLKCQYDIALPVLEKYNIKAFFFIYTSIFNDNYKDKLHIYAKFRNNYFDIIDDFYKIFFDFVINDYCDELKSFNPSNYLPNSPFYSDNDRKYRYIRDEILTSKKYDEILDKLFKQYNTSCDELLKNIYISKNEILDIHNKGHMIGLHSENHPTNMNTLSKEIQYNEYFTNFNNLKEITGINPVSMAHPCGKYNKDTLEVLKELNIRIGFNAFINNDNNNNNNNNNNLQLMREDCTNILKKII
jgi:peptidoglycan/xylan/chitin deacetylase (PgdA/CDA1 family)